MEKRALNSILNKSSRSLFCDGVATVTLLLLTVLFAFNYLQSVVLLDTARDIYFATEISHDGNWPMLGPDIGGFFHTGPIWFYFLALPALTGSLLIVAFWVGLFTGLKFFLAYRLGSELVTKEFGFLWAFMLLLPGWHVINQMVISHTNLQETLALFLLLMLYRFYLTAAIKYWLLAALTMGLGFHAHPAFLVMMVFYLPVTWKRKQDISVKIIAWAFGIFLLPLLPYLWDQLFNGMLDLDRFNSRNLEADQIRATGGTLTEQTWFTHWLNNMSALLIRGPQRIIEFVDYHVPNLGFYMRWIYVIVMSVVIMGVLLLIKEFKACYKGFVLGIGGLLLAMLIVTFLRSFTPYYMLLSLTPVLTGLFAFAAYQVLKYSVGIRLLYLFLLFCLGLIPYFAFHKAVKHHQFSLGPVMNINQKLPEDWVLNKSTLDSVSIAESNHIASYFCEKSTIINGPFAPVVDFIGGVIFKFYCENSQIQLGGAISGSQQGLFLMHKSFWDSIDKQPESWLSSSWGLTEKYQNHSSHAGLDIQPFSPYVHPPRSNTAVGSQQIITKELVTKDAPFLILTNVLPANMVFSVTEISANNQPVELVVANAANRLYHCSGCGNKAVTWQFSLKTNYAKGIDINTLPE